MALFRPLPAPVRRSALRQGAVALFMGLAGAGIAAGPAGATGAATGALPGDWQLTYRIYVGGIHVLDATAHLGLTDEAYRIGVQARTDGFLGWVANWRADIIANGILTGEGRPQPALYRSVGAWRDEVRNTTLEYDPDGTPRLTVAEPPPEKDREPVPDDLKPDTVDPMTAIVAAMQAVAAGRGCEASVPVYDGRQRYDLTFVPKGVEDLPPSDLSVFDGQAQACGFEFKPLAGAWKDQDRRRDRDENNRGRRGRDGRDVTVWVASAAPDSPPVPVRAQASSPLGTVMIHLAGIAPVPPAGKEQAAHIAD